MRNWHNSVISEEKMKNINIIYKKIDELKPYKNNPRKNDKAVKAVADSIKEFGFKVPIILDSNMEIIAGHTRLKAAKRLKYKEVPCIIADDLTPDQVRAFRLVDNKVGELAEWDIDLLNIELSEIELDLTPFEFKIEKTVNDIEEDNFEVVIPDEPKSKKGDIYILGNHRLMCGDSTNKDDVRKLMNGNKADIAFSSPPYNAGTTATETAMGKTTKYNGNDDNKAEADYIDFLNSYIECAIEHCEYVFVNVQSISNNKIALIDVLYHNKELYADTIIWDKIHGQPAMAENVMNSVFEYVHIFSQKANRAVGTIQFRGTIDNILHLQPQRKNEYSDIHNATFSVEFASHFIRNFAKESVLDQFGGTGTTLIACEQLDRICYMMELDEKYVDVIIDRWEKFTGRKAVKVE
jgi:DNA modification methylase